MKDYNTAFEVYVYPKAEMSHGALFYWKGDIVGYYDMDGKFLKYVGIVSGSAGALVNVRFWNQPGRFLAASVLINPDRLVRLGKVVE